MTDCVPTRKKSLSTASARPPRRQETNAYVRWSHPPLHPLRYASRALWLKSFAASPPIEASDLTPEIIGAAIRIHRKLGPGIFAC